ncbi:MAG TPA: hypothetical protein VLZ89_08625 [Anaerolineales bacterium]|nr:hypothetical protein [Anaerolineales bacterium]
MSDAPVAGVLFAYLDKALARYDMTAAGRASLKAMLNEDFDQFAQAPPEGRKSCGAAVVPKFDPGHALKQHVKR